MQFENVNIENLVSNFKDFSVEGFNIFATDKDNLPHLICICPNKDFARAMQSLLIIAKQAQTLQVYAYITSHRYLSSKILADGSLGMVGVVIHDAAYVDGQDMEYENFVSQFLDMQEKEGGA